VKYLLYLVFALVFLSACSQELSAEEEAAKAAQSYYQLLKDNQIEMFLQGKVKADSIPQGYRMQMLKVYEQYLREVKETHKGINEVRISENVAQFDSSGESVYAFLVLCFGDSTQEEITVPMLEKDGVWKMK